MKTLLKVLLLVACAYASAQTFTIGPVPYATDGQLNQIPLTITGGKPPYRCELVSASPDTNHWLQVMSYCEIWGEPSWAETEQFSVYIWDANYVSGTASASVQTLDVQNYALAWSGVTANYDGSALAGPLEYQLYQCHPANELGFCLGIVLNNGVPNAPWAVDGNYAAPTSSTAYSVPYFPTTTEPNESTTCWVVAPVIVVNGTPTAWGLPSNQVCNSANWNANTGAQAAQRHTYTYSISWTPVAGTYTVNITPSGPFYPGYQHQYDASLGTVDVTVGDGDILGVFTLTPNGGQPQVDYILFNDACFCGTVLTSPVPVAVSPLTVSP